jgi:adenylate kinase family enzyme
MIEGNPSDDEAIVTAVAAAIRKCCGDQAIGAPGNSWILVDFPRTRNQAQLLEKELSGY